MSGPASDTYDLSTTPGPGGLVRRLAEEMAQRWRNGERPLAEEFLARHPELADRPEAAAELIYEEICLREKYAQQTDPGEVLDRFPQWRPQLEVLLACHRLLELDETPPDFPQVGETVGACRLLAELGRGALGRVFLATQPALASRPVVLKLVPLEGREHLALARLQHTHIVPLYGVEDVPGRRFRALCMPFFGGVPLSRLLYEMRDLPVGQRTGRDLVRVLERSVAQAPVAGPARGLAWEALTQSSFIEAICGMGICLADALQFAHDRGLAHLDLKPSNLLLAGDGQPMLLDFHLARSPLRAGDAAPQWLGGTPAYMSREQRAAMAAVRQGHPIPVAVDHRSDVFSLGLVLYEALAGKLPAGPTPLPLERANPMVSPGLADIVARCLAPDPARRYQHASALAADLRRHLADQPLQGVPNRSLAERWRKWRRRRPYSLAVSVLLAALLLTGTAVTVYFGRAFYQAEAALAEGQRLAREGHYAEAQAAFRRGLDRAEQIPGGGRLTRDLRQQLERADNSQAVRELRRLADQIRFLAGVESLSVSARRSLAASCRGFWDRRDRVLERFAQEPPEEQKRIRADLLDLAVLGADLRMRVAPSRDAGRLDALEMVDQAEALFGPSPVLDQERQALGEAQGNGRPAGINAPPETAWEYYALGRSFLRSGQPERAAEHLRKALDLRPDGLWPNFYWGTCAYRLGKYQDAVIAFSVCVGAAPDQAGCYFNRALALAALGRADLARHDYDHALRLSPGHAPAALHRGLLHLSQKRLDAAAADLHLALEKGADPATVHYHLAEVHLAAGDRAAARASARRALQYASAHLQARRLLDRLDRER